MVISVAVATLVLVLLLVLVLVLVLVLMLVLMVLLTLMLMLVLVLVLVLMLMLMLVLVLVLALVLALVLMLMLVLEQAKLAVVWLKSPAGMLHLLPKGTSCLAMPLRALSAYHHSCHSARMTNGCSPIGRWKALTWLPWSPRISGKTRRLVCHGGCCSNPLMCAWRQVELLEGRCAADSPPIAPVSARQQLVQWCATPAHPHTRCRKPLVAGSPRSRSLRPRLAGRSCRCPVARHRGLGSAKRPCENRCGGTFAGVAYARHASRA